MGWDAFATGPRGGEIKVYYPRLNGGADDPYILNETLRKAFKDAAKRARRRAGSVDGGLDHGILNCSNCAAAIEDATGEFVFTENPWSPEYVKSVYESARWDFDERRKEMLGKWAIESAREFLRVCAENDLGIRFSF